MLFSLVYVALI